MQKFVYNLIIYKDTPTISSRIRMSDEVILMKYYGIDEFSPQNLIKLFVYLLVYSVEFVARMGEDSNVHKSYRKIPFYLFIF